MYDLVCVRVAPMHHRPVALNEQLRALDAHFLDTGAVSRESAAATETDGR